MDRAVDNNKRIGGSNSGKQRTDGSRWIVVENGEGSMDVRTCGEQRIDGWMGGWMDGWMEPLENKSQNMSLLLRDQVCE